MREQPSTKADPPRLPGILVGGAVAIARAVVGDGVRLRARRVGEQVGRGARTLRADLGRVREDVVRFGTDLRGVRHDARRVRESLGHTRRDLGTSLRRTAAALAGRTPAHSDEGAGASAAPSGDGHRVIPVARDRTSGKPPFPTPQPEDMPSTRPFPKTRGPRGGEARDPGGQDPRWGA